jgi:hypothetical protein
MSDKAWEAWQHAKRALATTLPWTADWVRLRMEEKDCWATYLALPEMGAGDRHTRSMGGSSLGAQEGVSAARCARSPVGGSRDGATGLGYASPVQTSS